MKIKTLESFNLSDSIKFHDQLNPKLFVNNKPRPEVKKQLLIIAKDFISELGIKDIDIEDLTISGSNAAYTYTKHSDLDLHILVDYTKLPDNEVYRELLNAKKIIYNDTHDIKVHGIPVELYVQDSNEPVISLGEYSLLKNKWLRIPVKRQANLDQTLTRHKYNKLYNLVQLAIKTKNLKKIETLLKTMRRYRQAGLDKGGEFSPENLSYKMLRSQGWLTKLYKLKDQLHSKKLSIENIQENKNLFRADKKVPQEATLNYFNESPKRVTYCPYFTKENLTETEQYLNKVNGTVPMNVWLTLIEQFLGNKYLIEDKVSEIVSQVNRIENLSIKNPTIGKKYIPIPILVLGNNIYIMDILGKDDLQTPAQPLPLVGIGNNVYSFKFKDRLIEYPFNTTYKSVYSTVIVASITTYDKIRMLIELYFDKSLPPIKKTNIEENSSKYIFSEKEKNDPRFKTALKR